MSLLETRPAAGDPASRVARAFAPPLVAIALTVISAMVLFVLLGRDPGAALRVLFLAPFEDLPELALKAAPLALCAAGLAVSFRGNVWNIGAEGQLVVGAIAAGAVAMQVAPEATFEWWPIALLAGAAGGIGWAAITGWLRDRFGANEILVSLMLVYVAQLLLGALLEGPWRDPDAQDPQTRMFEAAALLPVWLAGTRLHVGVPLALVVVLGVWLFQMRSAAGYRIRVGGMAPHAAAYAGFNGRASLWIALVISGGCAGLAGALEAIGPTGQLTPAISSGFGFTAIIIAFMARLNAGASLLAALALAVIHVGGELAQSRLSLPPTLTGVFQGLLLLYLLLADTLAGHRIRWNWSAS